MINPHDLGDLLHAYKTMSPLQFLSLLDGKLAYAKENYVCDITWQIEDIQTLRPDWTFERIASAGDRMAKYLCDRSTEEGWQILDDLLDIYEADNPCTNTNSEAEK